MCAPSWADPAAFSWLAGGRGGFSAAPSGRHVRGGYYEPGTLIWHSRWATTDGLVESREALAYPGDPDRVVLLRRFDAVDAPTHIEVLLELCGEFGSAPVRDLACTRGVWTGHLGGLDVRLSGLPRARRTGTGHRRDQLAASFALPKDGRCDLVLEVARRPITAPPIDVDQAWKTTEAAWKAAVPEFDRGLAPADSRRTYAVLTGLTSRSGGTVAAATAGLPERAEAGRNYDYRYSWIRDQCYIGQAIAADGPHPLLDGSVDFVTRRVLEDGPELAPAYGVDGSRVPDQHDLDLPGYPGGSLRVGNWVNQQFQLDAFGEVLLLLAAAARHDRLDDQGWEAVTTTAGAIEAGWQRPDAGIWEIDDRRWTHSRLMCAAGLRAAAEVAPAQSAHVARWSALADAIVADAATWGLTASGAWKRSSDDDGCDAALLLPALRGALPMQDPRSIATLHEVLDTLAEQHFCYRFRHGPGRLGQAEGAFVLCGFLAALSLERCGDHLEAVRWFERNRTSCGPAGLFTEEVDVREHQLRGNLPQAFAHALMFEASIQLAG
jgi:hypothetical protein